MKLELDRIERKSYKLTSCIIVHRQLLRKVAAGLKVSHDFPHILLVTPIKFVYCATAVHSHWQPLLPSHEGRRSSSADSAFPPAPPLPGPLVLASGHPTSHFFQSSGSQNKDILFLSMLLLVRSLIVLIWNSCAISHDKELSRNLITSHWLSYQLHDLITPWLKTWHQRKIQAAFNMFASRPSARD